MTRITVPGKYARQSDNWTVELEWVSNGSLVQITYRDSLGIPAHRRTVQYETDAVYKVRTFLES